MLKEKFEKAKELLTNKDASQKKKLENLIFLLVLLIIVIIAINLIWQDEPVEEEESDNKQLVTAPTNTISQSVSIDNQTTLQNDLKVILSKITGAGSVEVLITYSQTSEIVPIFNENNKQSTIEETDNNGGVRTTEQADTSRELAYIEENGEKLPITQKVIMPQIEGAIILAEGAENAEVKNNIIQAVGAVTGLTTHKIQVFKLDA